MDERMVKTNCECCILIVFANLNVNNVSSVFKQLAASMSVNATR